MEKWMDHVMELAKGLLSMEVDSWMTGVNLNVTGKQKRIVARYTGSAPAYRARCEEIAAGAAWPFNPDSPKQLSQVLFNAPDHDPPGLGLRVVKKTTTGASTDSEVLEKLAPIEREVRDESGQWYLTRLLPYRSAQDRIGGVVITFVDITVAKELESRLRKA